MEYEWLQDRIKKTQQDGWWKNGKGVGRGKQRQHNRAEEVQELTDNKEQKGRRKVEKTRGTTWKKKGLI